MKITFEGLGLVGGLVLSRKTPPSPQSQPAKAAPEPAPSKIPPPPDKRPVRGFGVEPDREEPDE